MAKVLWAPNGPETETADVAFSSDCHMFQRVAVPSQWRTNSRGCCLPHAAQCLPHAPIGFKDHATDSELTLMLALRQQPVALASKQTILIPARQVRTQYYAERRLTMASLPLVMALVCPLTRAELDHGVLTVGFSNAQNNLQMWHTPSGRQRRRNLGNLWGRVAQDATAGVNGVRTVGRSLSALWLWYENTTAPRLVAQIVTWSKQAWLSNTHPRREAVKHCQLLRVRTLLILTRTWERGKTHLPTKW